MNDMTTAGVPVGTQDTMPASDQASLTALVALLSQCRDDPTEGLAGYLVTEDPTYLPENPEIKRLIRVMGRDKLLRLVLTAFLHPQAPRKDV